MTEIKSCPDIVERAKRELRFWGNDATGHSITMIRDLVAEVDRLRSGICTNAQPFVQTPAPPEALEAARWIIRAYGNPTGREPYCLTVARALLNLSNAKELT